MAFAPKNRPARPPPQDWFSELIDCACNAGVQAFIIVTLGNVALNIVGSVVDRMIPSAPPGLAAPTAGWGTLHIWWNADISLKFYFLFAVLLYLSLREKYFGPAGPVTTAAAPARWRRISHRFSENWFGSVVGNAFLAMALATALAAIPKLSVWQWTWHWLPGFLSSRFDVGLDGAGAGGWVAQMKAWFNWYVDNELRFNFWAIYLGAMCDDFGIPNFKSVARWLWRRCMKPKTLPTCPVANAGESGKR